MKIVTLFLVLTVKIFLIPKQYRNNIFFKFCEIRHIFSFHSLLTKFPLLQPQHIVACFLFQTFGIKWFGVCLLSWIFRIVLCMSLSFLSWICFAVIKSPCKIISILATIAKFCLHVDCLLSFQNWLASNSIKNSCLLTLARWLALQ